MKPVYAGVLVMLAIWFSSALVLHLLQPTLGAELAGVLMMAAGALGALAFATVKAAVSKRQKS